jgi:photosystem II stability/assembly factor-like uncharacterized protein
MRVRLYIFGILVLISFLASSQQWHHQNPLPSSEDYNCIFFTSSDTGFIIGGGGIILKTTNAGTTWSYPLSGTNKTLRSIFFTNANTGYIAATPGIYFVVIQ